MATPKITPPTPCYYVTHQGEVRGPFDLQFIEAMVMAGQFAGNIPACEVGTEAWVPFDFLTQPSPLSNLPDKKTTESKRKYVWDSPANISLIIAGSVVTLIVGIVALNDSNKPSRRIAQHVSKPAYASPTPSHIPPKTVYTPSSYTPTESHQHVSEPIYTSATPSPIHTPPKRVYSQSSYVSHKPVSHSSRVNTDSALYKDAQGTTYRISNLGYQLLHSKKSSLETQQESIALAKSKVESLGAEIDRLRRTLDRTSQYQINSFNSNVNRFNAMNAQLKIKINSYNAAVDAYNAELRRVGTPVQ